MIGKVYLVGAGPGDPGLITIKGLRCIKDADVLIYHQSVSPRLLDYAAADCLMVPAGQAPGKDAMNAFDINANLVHYAKAGKTVTRLNAGDPFAFGRGSEEALALAEEGIPCEVVPGVTAAAAAPAYAGIPLTDGTINSSVTIITGEEDPYMEKSKIPWEQLVDINTLVFMMGLKNLEKITLRLISAGKDPETPVAVVQEGTTPEQKTVSGTLASITGMVRQAGIKHPAVTVIGHTANLREQLRWVEDKPLFGKRILISRPVHQAAGFAEMIETLGGEPYIFPVIDIVKPSDSSPLDNAIDKVEQFDWVVFTSVNGVNHFFRAMWEKKKDIRCLAEAKICAIGPKTAAAVEKKGLLVDYMPEEYVAEAVIEGMKDYGLKGMKVLLPRADIARQVLPEKLMEMGALVEEVTAYETVTGSGDPDKLLQLLSQGKLHVVTFTSSSTVRNFLSKLPRQRADELLKDVIIACIGPITAETARKMGLTVHIEAEEYTIDGLLAAILQYI
ncbi:uroporphyrinogen-III C-methyltransferase [Metallumcola ferriviriculae]|uniref:uroporphyrinogen-III C-methyltransferase n=1 Tax=Metallumcola ferriviriculae TaxID=3039180 RepID=A0AAU0UP21_9FIRM|nr:uroporphyrinogen-III C-methyltransferase [Desulfitibacteraceae bacterium MK1]